MPPGGGATRWSATCATEPERQRTSGRQEIGARTASVARRAPATAGHAEAGDHEHDEGRDADEDEH
ncbi:hypothetical protein, partial [Polymorphospora rubra]|uniref:hypothetical protein n=1 Tax=Polymorphospora rubra TaxID=338584 RepID=UPI0034042B76